MAVRRSGFQLEIFLVSFAALLLEISYTRIFSFKVSSYYTYLIIGFALLGMGAGGVLVAVSSRLRAQPLEALLPRLCLAGGACVAAGYLAVAWAPLDTYQDPTDPGPLAALVLVCGVLFASFLAVGLAIAAIFSRDAEHVPRLYAADLAGAGCGCAAAVPLILALSPPGCVFAAAAALAAAGLRLAAGRSRAHAGASAAAVAALGLVALAPDVLPEIAVDEAKLMGRANQARWRFESAFQRWHPVFRVDVLDSPLLKNRKMLLHDGDAGSSLWEYDGDPASLATTYDASSRALPFAVAREAPRVLVIGAAGGNEIRASLHFGAGSVTAVELNPVSVSLLTDHFADFTGRLPEDERVSLVNAEGRSFLRRDDQSYDLIWFVAPDSYASMNAAAASGFVLAESYLYTVEMVEESLRHLRPGGILCMQSGEVNYARKPNRTARYLATARAAFARLGIHDFARHVLVATNPDFPTLLSTMLLSREPFSEQQIRAFEHVAGSMPTGKVRHSPGRTSENAAPNRVISLPPAELAAFFASHAYDVSPVYDDAPFFWHFARFGDVLRGGRPMLRAPIGPEDGRGERVLLVMLALATAFAAVFLLAPFALVRERWRALPRKPGTLVYFAALGLGFMCFEIPLIQKLTLFLGYPTYTLTVTLFALLVFSGIGSLAAGRALEHRDRALPALVAGVVLLALFFQLGIDPAVDAWIGAPLALRIALSVLVLAPLGLCLGAFLPLGLATVARLSPYAQEYVAWSWAVNGVFSVIGSMLATMLSMSFGFRAVLGLAAALYVAAGLALRALPLGPRAPGP